MAEEIFSGYGATQSDTKRQKLLECVLTGNSKLYPGKVYTEKKIKELNDEEVEKLFNNYEAKLSGQMVKSLGKLIINRYSLGACAASGISNQDALNEDLESDPFLNSALQRFTCGHYLSERNKNGGTSGMEDEQKLINLEYVERSYWIIYKYRSVRFLVWNWNCFRC